jgi:hypothetical protein
MTRETRQAKKARKAEKVRPPPHLEGSRIQDNPGHHQEDEAFIVPGALSSLIQWTLGQEENLEERVEEGRGSEPSVTTTPTITPLAGSGLEREEQFLEQIVSDLKRTKESKKRKKLKPSFRTA